MRNIKEHLVFLLFVVMIIIFTGCKYDTEKTYVDVDSKLQGGNFDSTLELNDTKGIDIEINNFEYDDKPFNIMRMNTTISSDYIYLFNSPNLKIDVKSGGIVNLCEIPGCSHTENSPNCVNYQQFNSPVASIEGIYYVDNNRLMLHNGAKEIEIARNNYSTKYEEETYPDSPSIISAITISKELIYLICPTYYRTYNINTKELSQPYYLCDNFVMSLAVTNDYLYYCDDSLQFYQFSLTDNKVTKIGDKVGQVSSTADRVYYVQYENETPNLYSMEPNGIDPYLLIKDCYVNYVVSDNYIYYQTKDKKVYCMNLDDKSKQEIVLDDGKDDADYDYSPGLLNVFSLDVSSSVFLLDNSNNLLFVIKSGGMDYTRLKLGEE